MKIAIHHRVGSFSDGWIKYCKEKKIPYKIVNAYDSDIVKQIEDCDAFMWHHHHANYKDVLFAKQLLYSLELGGKKVFPNYRTTWHFDDKIGQKYLLESISAPLISTYVFYTKKDALEWINQASFPKVFKLRSGAGSTNVRLVKNKSQAKKLVEKAFGSGFSQFDGWIYFKECLNKWNSGVASFFTVCKGFFRIFISTEFAKNHAPEKGYIYFQDFIPNNDTDTRIIVVGDKIIGERRGCRKNDFRASGSNILLPDVSKVDLNCVKIAYQFCKQNQIQMCVFDFIHGNDGIPLIVEISYGTSPDYSECMGYWDSEFAFHKAYIDLPQMIIESFINELK